MTEVRTEAPKLRLLPTEGTKLDTIHLPRLLDNLTQLPVVLVIAVIPDYISLLKSRRFIRDIEASPERIYPGDCADIRFPSCLLLAYAPASRSGDDRRFRSASLQGVG
jgi:hypothetical protein